MRGRRDPAAHAAGAAADDGAGGQTLRLIAEGLSAPAIGATLHPEHATVKTHLQHIYEKLGVSERAAAVAEAMRRGLLE